MRISHLLYFLPIAVLMVAGGCTPLEQQGKTDEPSGQDGAIPSLTLSAAQEAFVNGTAYISLQLSSTSQTDVIVSLSAGGDIDAKRLSFDNPVTIKSGSTSAAAVVSVKDEGLRAGEYNVTISVEGAAGAKLADPSSVRLKHTVRQSVATVSLSGPERFTDGKATLSLSTDVPPLHEITVKLEVMKYGAGEGKELISPGAISCPETVVIPADKAEPTTFQVRVDMSQVKPVESEAIIAIEEVSAWGSIGDADEVHIGVKGELEARLRTDWSLSYEGDFPREDQAGVIKTYIRVDGFYSEDGGGYYIRYSNGGFVAQGYGSMAEYLQYIEGVICSRQATDSPLTFWRDNDRHDMVRLPAGSYDFYMLGCDAQGHLTGDYAKLSFSRAPTDKMREAYYEWLGTWEVNGQEWKVNMKEEYRSYYIQGIGGNRKDPGFVAYLGWDGELEIRGENYLDITEGEWYGLYGIYSKEDGTEKTYVSSYDGPVAKAVYADSWAQYAQWSACINPSTGKPFERMDLCSFTDGSAQWSIALLLPEFMSRSHEGKLPEDANLDARYAPIEAFEGDWLFHGEKVTFSPGTNVSLIIYCVVDEHPTSVTVQYDPAGGFAYIPEQVLFEEPYNASYKWAYALSGAWYNDEKSDLYPHFPYVSLMPGTAFVRLYMQRDGTVCWSAATVDHYWLYAYGLYLFVWSNDHSQYYGAYGWVGDPVHMIGGDDDTMYRP